MCHKLMLMQIETSNTSDQEPPGAVKQVTEEAAILSPKLKASFTAEEEEDDATDSDMDDDDDDDSMAQQCTLHIN